MAPQQARCPQSPGSTERNATPSPVAGTQRTRLLDCTSRGQPYVGSDTMLDQAQRQAIVDSFRLVVPIAETAAELFYKRLFELRPDYRAMFPEDMEAQRRKLVTMLAFIVKALDYEDSQWRDRVAEDDDLFYVLLALGRRHSTLYEIPEDSYGPVAEALLWTLDQGLGEAFTPTVKAAWTTAYGDIATTMKMGAYSQIDINQGKVA